MKTLYTRFDGSNSEGIGSILQGVLHLYAYCKINNFNFGFRELSNISHYQYTGMDSPTFNKRINEFFNLPNTNQDFDEQIDAAWLILDWGEKFNVEKKEWIKELFKYVNYNGQIFFNPNKKSISLHIRNINSEDVSFDERRELYSETKKKYYLTLLKNVIRQLDCEYEIHIFSQGSPEDFLIFEQEFGAILHINEDIITTLYHLMISNIFLTSNSSFSWVCHLYGQNDKVYSRDNFFHSWYTNTILVDYDGNIK